MENQPDSSKRFAPMIVYAFWCGMIVVVTLLLVKVLVSLPPRRFVAPRQIEGGDNPSTVGGKRSPNSSLYTGGELCTDLEFSPDGELIAESEHDLGSPGNFTTRIYRLPEGHLDSRQALVTTIPDAGPHCAWSNDGATFAAISAKTPGVDLFETETWKKIQHLEPPDHIKYLHSLFFDAQGNLFTVGDREHLSTNEYRPCVWWRGTSQAQTTAEKIDVSGVDSAFSVAVFNDGGSIRMAITENDRYATVPRSLHIFRVQHNDAKGTVVVKESAIPGIGLASVQFGGTGKIIAVLREDELRVFQSKERSEEVVWSRFFPGNPNPELRSGFGPLIASRDGRFLAGVAEGNCVLVLRAADLRTVLEIHEINGIPALSPDGRLLAVRTASSHIQFFVVPQG